MRLACASQPVPGPLTRKCTLPFARHSSWPNCGEVVAVVVAVVVTDVVTDVVAERVTEVVAELVAELVCVVVGEVISHSSNVPSRKESTASERMATVALQVPLVSTIAPSTVHSSAEVTEPLEYSVTIAIRAWRVVVHSELDTLASIGT